MAAPDWSAVVDISKPSIFFVVMRPKGLDEKKEIWAMAREARSKRGKERADACNAIEHYATGFAVGTVGEAARQKILVLTCAHTIEHIYHGARQPIDVGTVNRLYHIELTCSHSELNWMERGGQGPRSSFAAMACSIDCSKDMLLLTANVMDISLRTQHNGRGRLTQISTERCVLPHPELHFSDVLQMGHPCLILSWPSNLIHLFCQGHQCELRVMRLMSANAAGYDMSVLEAQIGSTEGSSGAPLVNIAGQVIGVLHGGFGQDHSYFVPPQHIQQFLATAREEAAAAAAAEETATAATIQRLDAAWLAWCGLRRPPRSERSRRDKWPRSR